MFFKLKSLILYKLTEFIHFFPTVRLISMKDFLKSNISGSHSVECELGGQWCDLRTCLGAALKRRGAWLRSHFWQSRGRAILTVLGRGWVNPGETKTVRPVFENQKLAKGSQGHIPDISLEWYLHCHLNILIDFCHLDGAQFRAWQIAGGAGKSPKGRCNSARAQKPALRVDGLSFLSSSLAFLLEGTVIWKIHQIWGSVTHDFTSWFCNLLANYRNLFNSNFSHL